MGRDGMDPALEASPSSLVVVVVVDGKNVSTSARSSEVNSSANS
jgi:hypothetical protein